MSIILLVALVFGTMGLIIGFFTGLAKHKELFPEESAPTAEQTNTSLVVPPSTSMGEVVQNKMVVPSGDRGRWLSWRQSKPALPTLPAGAYADNPLRSYERIVERISELQTGIHEALEANDIEVLRRKNLVQPKDWIGIRTPLTAQVYEPTALPEPKE